MGLFFEHQPRAFTPWTLQSVINTCHYDHRARHGEHAANPDHGARGKEIVRSMSRCLYASSRSFPMPSSTSLSPISNSSL